MNVEFCADNSGNAQKMRYFRKNGRGGWAPSAPSLDTPLYITGTNAAALPKLLQLLARDATYRKIPDISPGLIQLRKGFWVGL